MTVQLHPLDLLQLAALLAGERAIDGVDLSPGALPPDFILASAAAALRQGRPAHWHAPRLFVPMASATAVGSGGFKGEPVAGRVEIGYGMAEAYRGQGFASEAARQLVDQAWLATDVHEVYAETAVDNPASRRVVEKAGFVHIGQRDSTDDGLVDQWLIRRA